jgi:hypothetical protein
MSLLHGSETLSTIAQQMKDAGVNAMSIALMTSCPEQYDQLMSPKQQHRGGVLFVIYPVHHYHHRLLQHHLLQHMKEFVNLLHTVSR